MADHSRRPVRLLSLEQPFWRGVTIGDVVAIGGVAAAVFVGVHLSLNAPAIIRGPQISLDPTALPYYAALSLGRMGAAFALSFTFSLIYGYAAVSHERAERILVPLLDVLQSIPILSFLPVALLSFSALFPQGVAAELASIVLIFTSQAWNLTFAWYQSLRTVPKDLKEASATFRFNGWMRFKVLELPFGAVSLIWNSMMSWAGGWFFLMAAEIFTVGNRDFRLPGIGSYLREASTQGNVQAIIWGIAVLVLLILLLDQLVWRPLLAWSDRFKLEMVDSAAPPTSWVYDVLRNAHLVDVVRRRVIRPAGDRIDRALLALFEPPAEIEQDGRSSRLAVTALAVIAAAVIALGLYRAGLMLVEVPAAAWGSIGLGLLATLARVALALALALAWTLPVGVAIGTNPKLSAWVQPVVQVAASVPATAIFPVFLLVLLGLPAGLNLAAVLLMLTGTQWYLLFNIIAGASAIPQDLKFTSSMMGFGRWERWRTLILPSLYPYLVTGAITASGGAWNASIVAEHFDFAGRSLSTVGIGALIDQATAAGNDRLLLASTLAMILAVAAINRLVWRPLYASAESRFRLE